MSELVYLKLEILNIQHNFDNRSKTNNTTVQI